LIRVSHNDSGLIHFLISRLRYVIGTSFLIFAGSHAFAQTCDAPSCWPGKFYKFEVMAQAPSTIPLPTPVYLTGFGNQPSINENGVVAFVGQTAPAPASSASSSDGLFMNNGSGQPTYATAFPSFFNAKRSFDSAVQINNANQIVARDTIPGSPPPSYIRIWDGNNPDGVPCPPPSTALCINETDIAIGSATSSHFSSVLTQPAINGSNEVVFSALDPSSKAILATPNGAASYNTTQPPLDNIPLRPLIDNQGNVVTRNGNLTTDPIVRYQYNLGTPPLVIGDTSSDFSVVGQSPGVSRDGVIVAFAGNMTTAGAQHWNTNPGPGVFIMVFQNSGELNIFRVAGFANDPWPSACSQGYSSGAVVGTTCIESIADKDLNSYPDPPGTNHDGYCDPEEICKTTYELENLPPSNSVEFPIGAYFYTFDPSNFPNATSEWNQRIGVMHTDFGAASTAVVSFIATPNMASAVNLFTANSGLWTVQVDLVTQGGSLLPKVHKPIPVIQVGDKLGSQTTVTAISVYDPIANALVDELGNARVPTPGDHEVAFWVSTSAGGQMIIRVIEYNLTLRPSINTIER